MISQYIKRDRSKIHYTEIPFYMVFRIGRFLDISKNALFWLSFECLTALFTISQIWLYGRVKEIKMSAYFFWIYLKSFCSRDITVERWTHITPLWDIPTYHFPSIYWSNKAFVSKKKKSKHDKFICESIKIIPESWSSILGSNTQTNARSV